MTNPITQLHSRYLQAYGNFFSVLTGNTPDSATRADRERVYDAANDILKSGLYGFERFAVFYRRGDNIVGSYFRLSGEKRRIMYLPVGRDSIAWKTVETGERQLSTPTEGPRQKPTFTEITGEKIDYLVSDPLRYNGQTFGCVQYVLSDMPDVFLENMLTGVTLALASKEQDLMNDTLVHRFSHLVRGKNTVIRGYTGLLKRFVHDTIPIDMIDGIDGAVVDLTRFSDSLLKSASVSYKGLESEEFDVNRLVSEMAGKIREFGERTGKHIQYSTDLGEVPVQQIDVNALLNEVLYQLFENAREAHEKRQTERKTSDNLSVRYKTDMYSDSVGQYTVIRVTDNAGGMPKKISDILNSEEGSLLELAEFGHGFGLHLARQIVREHGGRLRIIPEQDVGTTFEVYLPLN